MNMVHSIVKCALALALISTVSCGKKKTAAPSTAPAPAQAEAEAQYKSVKIGEQVWMAENLNIEVEGSKCCEDKPENCEKYGRLYTWDAAMKACPAGWHLPDTTEWSVLTAFVGGKDTEGKVLKAKSGWVASGNGTDEFGFAALPGGYGGSDGSFLVVGGGGHWWSASENNASSAYNRVMRYRDEYAYWANDGDKRYYFSVRCLHD